jgi:hypothetical protein
MKNYHDRVFVIMNNDTINQLNYNILAHFFLSLRKNKVEHRSAITQVPQITYFQMPGPKMGARPHDFDEKLVRDSPTFKKWELLNDGQKLRYACRDFIKGHGEDEERLMRRIMIARRNNLRDHEILKQARKQIEDVDSDTSSPKQGIKEKEVVKIPPTKRRRCAVSHSLTDEELRREMDTPAIEATRSYKAWIALPDGEEFTYNQKYIKGREGHDWLLRKNIWRRMRYRRHNKTMVEKLKHEIVGDAIPPILNSNTSHNSVAGAYNASDAAATATQIVDQTLLAAGSEPNNMPTNGDEENLHAAVVEAAVAAVAAAESYVNQARESDNTELLTTYSDVKHEDVSESVAIAPSVHNPIISDQQDTNLPEGLSEHHTPNPLVSFDGDALDVAAKLAAAASAQVCKLEDSNNEQECIGI